MRDMVDDFGERPDIQSKTKAPPGAPLVKKSTHPNNFDVFKGRPPQGWRDAVKVPTTKPEEVIVRSTLPSASSRQDATALRAQAAQIRQRD